MKVKVFLPVIIISAVAVIILIIFMSGLPFSSKEAAILNNARLLEKHDKTAEAIKEYERLIAEYPETNQAGQAYVCLADLREKEGKLAQARDAYKKAVENYPSLNDAQDIRAKIEDLNIKILFSPVVDGLSRIYDVQPGDSLAKIARVFGTTVGFLKRSNNLNSDTIKQGMRLKVVTAKLSIFVDKSQNLLFLKANDEIIKTYTVSTGANNSTPSGTFKIETKLVDPVWYSNGIVIPAGSSENILGTRWMAISKQGYGIHGTTDPGSLGRQVTAGCVRMLNADIEELYIIVPSGTDVTIVD